MVKILFNFFFSFVLIFFIWVTNWKLLLFSLTRILLGEYNKDTFFQAGCEPLLVRLMGTSINPAPPKNLWRDSQVDFISYQTWCQEPNLSLLKLNNSIARKTSGRKYMKGGPKQLCILKHFSLPNYSHLISLWFPSICHKASGPGTQYWRRRIEALHLW